MRLMKDCISFIEFFIENKRNVINKVIAVLLLAIISITVFFFNLHTPLQLDDFDYRVNWATGVPVASLSDVIASQTVHYRIWGGRSFTHTLTQLFLLLGKNVFNYLNTAAYLLLILEISSFANGIRKCINWHTILISHFVLLIGVPFFGSSFLWLDGACNYLWGTLVAVLPLLISLEAERRGHNNNKFGQAFLILLCFIAGWTNENTAIGILGARMVYIGLKKRQTTIQLWELLSCLSQTVGLILMLSAPGNYLRARSAQGSNPFNNCIIVLIFVIAYATPFIYSILFVRALDNCNRLKSQSGWVCAIAGLLSGLAMIASPEFSERTLTGMVVLLTASFLAFSKGVFEKNKLLSVTSILAFPFLMVFMLFISYNGMKELKYHETRIAALYSTIEEAANEGAESVNVRSIYSRSRFTQDIVFSDNDKDWPNSTLSTVYGISIIGTDN